MLELSDEFVARLSAYCSLNKLIDCIPMTVDEAKIKRKSFALLSYEEICELEISGCVTQLEKHFGFSHKDTSKITDTESVQAWRAYLLEEVTNDADEKFESWVEDREMQAPVDLSPGQLLALEIYMAAKELPELQRHMAIPHLYRNGVQCDPWHDVNETAEEVENAE